MATGNKSYRNIPKLIGITFIAVILSSSFITSQTNSESRVMLKNIVKANILRGIQSDNYGLKMSSIYLAGKYKITDVSKELVKEMKASDNEEVCQMLVWSLYQIGDESCCKEMKAIIKNHPSEKIKSFCESMFMIKQYDSTNEKSDEKNS